jgi:hypothetical protein
MKIASGCLFLALLVGGPIQTRVPSPAAPAVASNNTFFVSWRDPRENAFEVGVPQGWRVTGGMVRPYVVETHSVIRAASPDGKIQIFNDDADLHPRQVPNQLTQLAGFREGQTIQAPWGGPVLLARYVTGSQFAQQYIQARLCRQPVAIASVMDLAEATARMNAAIAPYARQQGVPTQVSIGEASFRCGDSAGYVLANTLYTSPPGGPAGWAVYSLSGYIVSDPEQAGLAFYVLNTMIETYRTNPQWEARAAREVQDLTGAVTRMQNAMAQSIAEYGRRQASAASAGGFNHPNSGQLPTDLRKKWASEDASRQRISDATLGQTWVHSSSGANVRVDNSVSNWWRDPSGNVVAGPEGGGPPPGSQGQFEKLQPGWQP